MSHASWVISFGAVWASVGSFSFSEIVRLRSRSALPWEKTLLSGAITSITGRIWSHIFDPEKLNFPISSAHKVTLVSPGSYSLPYSLPSLWKICKRISQLSPFDRATWQHPGDRPQKCADSRGYITSRWRNLFSTQASQAKNTWCKGLFVYIENCMGKSPIMKKNV